MSTPPAFQSPLADVMGTFVEFKHMQGYDYRAKAEILKMFDRFLLGQDCSGGLLRPEHFSRYLETIAELSHSSREGQLSLLRQFSRYLHALRPESAVVPTGLLPRRPRNIRFCRITFEQVGMLMNAAAKLRMKYPVGPQNVRFLIGMLYACGLRIDEALSLNLGDIDQEKGTVFVRKGKFGKERLVVMSDSTAAALQKWLERRPRCAKTEEPAPLFIGGTNGRMTYCQASRSFQKLCRRCGLQANPSPRLHDLRHNFACRCIEQWREQGKDIQTLLPVLANAMGHVNFYATQVYIHVDAASLRQASHKFRNHFICPKEN